jgi:hypothetical protein
MRLLLVVKWKCESAPSNQGISGGGEIVSGLASGREPMMGLASSL